MNEWLEKFYNDPALRDTLLRSFLPVFSNYVSEATGGPVAAAFVQSLAESYVDRHLGSSRAQLQDLVKGSDDPLKDLAKRFEEWEEKRPEKVAKNELIRSANAAQVQAFRDAGVEKMVWAASGGACPFCQELDGVIISVNGTFFEPGDTLNPEGVEHPINFESTIGHPPVHQGCTCSVEAVAGEAQTEQTAFASPQEAEDYLRGTFPNLEIDLSDMDMSLNSDVVYQLDKLGKEFPEAARWLQRVEVGDPGNIPGSAVASIDPASRSLILNREYVKDAAGRAAWLEQDRLAAIPDPNDPRPHFAFLGHGPEGTITHEFGHVVDYSTRAQGGPNEWLKQRAFASEPEIAEMMGLEARPAVQGLSVYSDESGAEMLAEMFASQYYSPASEWSDDLREYVAVLDRFRAGN